MMLLKGKEVGGHLVLIYIVSVAYLGHCIFAQLGHSDKNKRRTFLNNEKYQTRKSYWETKIPIKKRKRETKRDKRDKRDKKRQKETKGAGLIPVCIGCLPVRRALLLGVHIGFT